MIVSDYRLDPPEPLDVLCRDCGAPLTDDDLEQWLADSRLEVDPVAPVCSGCRCIVCGDTMLLGSVACACAKVPA